MTRLLVELVLKLFPLRIDELSSLPVNMAEDIKRKAEIEKRARKEME